HKVFQSQLMKFFDDLLRDIDVAALTPIRDLEFKRIATIGRAEDRPTRVNDAAHVVGVEQMNPPALKQSFKSALDPVHLPASIDPADDNGTNHGVQTGAVASTGDQTNLLTLRMRLTSLSHNCSLCVTDQSSSSLLGRRNFASSPEPTILSDFFK